MAYLLAVKAPEIVLYYVGKGFEVVDNFIRKMTIILYKLRHRASQNQQEQIDQAQLLEWGYHPPVP